MKTTYSIIVLCLMLSGVSSAAIKSVQQKSNGLFILTDSDALFLRPWSEKTIEVQVAPGSIIPQKQSFAVVGEARPGKWTLSDGKDRAEYASPNLRVVVNKADGSLSFEDGNGQPLLNQKAWSFKPGKDPKREGLMPGATFSRDLAERLFGGGVLADELSRPHAEINMQNDYLQMHIPVLYSTRGYGIFWDNPSRSRLRLTPDAVSWESSAGDLADFYIFAGPSADEVIAQYRALTGQAALLPKWAYGFWYSRNKFNSQKEILGAAQTFRDRKFPIDMIIQDYFYWKPSKAEKNWEGWGTHQFTSDRYPDPKKMIDELHNDLHMQFMPVVWAKLDPSTEHGRELEQMGGLYPEHHDWAGQPMRYYDPFNKKALDIYDRQVMDSLQTLGVDGFWIDGAEPEINMDTYDSFETAAGPASRVFNAFPLEHTKGLSDAFRARETGKRVVLLPRSAWAGSQRNSTVAWTSDVNMDWSVLEWQIEGLQNFVMAGLPYVTTDIGGYSPTPENDSELFVRWFQWGTFCPIFRAHGCPRPYPWEYGEKAEAILKDFTQLRYRLLPYIYTQAGLVTFGSGNIMRPLAMDFRDDTKAVDTWDEFMFGPAILVCPVYKCSRESVATRAQLADLSGTPERVSATFQPRDGSNAAAVTASMKLRNRSDDHVRGLRSKTESFTLDGLTDEQKRMKSVRIDGTYTPAENGELQLEVTRSGWDLVKGVSVVLNGQPVEPVSHPDNRDPLAFRFKAKAGKPVKFALTSEAKDIDFLFTKPLPKPMQRNVYLPKGAGWYDFWTGEKFDGGASMNVETPIERIPLYVRAGSILPMGPEQQWVDEKAADPIELRIYRGADGSFALYEDEGNGTGYEKGARSIIPMSWDDTAQTLTIGAREGSFPGMLKSRTFKVVWVKPGHGVGRDVTDGDQVVTCAGEPVIVKFTGK